MDIKRMLVDLRNERQRVDQAIAALEALDGTGARAQVAGKHRLVGTFDSRQKCPFVSSIIFPTLELF